MPRHAQPLILTFGRKAIERPCAGSPFYQQEVCVPASFCAATMGEPGYCRRTGNHRAHRGDLAAPVAQEQLAGLEDAPRYGRPVSLATATVTQVLTTVTQPPKGRTRWSVRSMARSAGLSKSRVHQLWQANDLKLHQVRTFKLSRDPQFEAKFWDVSACI